MQDPVSLTRLAEIFPPLAAKVQAASVAMLIATGGKGFRVAQGLRTFAESDADYALGRTILTKPDGSPQAKVTNAPGGYSWHNFGMAVDCYPFVAGEAGALDWNANDPEFNAMVEAIKAQGLSWGGDWHSIKDFPHFQPSEIPVTPTDEDRAAFERGGVQAVWDQYA
mgnify:CR=1 FL=1